jgi:hypothetical protein
MRSITTRWSCAQVGCAAVRPHARFTFSRPRARTHTHAHARTHTYRYGHLSHTLVVRVRSSTRVHVCDPRTWFHLYAIWLMRLKPEPVGRDAGRDGYLEPAWSRTHTHRRQPTLPHARPHGRTPHARNAYLGNAHAVGWDGCWDGCARTRHALAWCAHAPARAPAHCLPAACLCTHTCLRTHAYAHAHLPRIRRDRPQRA